MAHNVYSYWSLRTETARFAGYSVEKDFLEAPSQMLENWCWNEEPLKLMSGHFEVNCDQSYKRFTIINYNSR